MSFPDSIDGSVRIGGIGVGGEGAKLAERTYGHPNATLAAISDLDEETLRTLGDRMDIPPASRFRDYRDMLTEESLDAVFIATPQGFHYEQIVAALDCDLHILCEKPLVTTLNDAEDIDDRVEGNDEVFMLGYQRHLNPAFVNARERWHSRDLSPAFITAEITSDWRQRYENDDNWRTDPDISGGGHLFNVGTHIIDAILWTTGLTPTSVDAQMSFHDDRQRIDTQSSTTIQFENGAIATVSDSGLVPRPREHIHVWDNDGAVYLSGREWEFREGTFIDSDGSERSPYINTATIPNKIDAFIDSIEGDDPPATARDGLRATAVLEAAYESARTSETAPVPL